MENKREPVLCPGCGRGMGVSKPIWVEGIGRFQAKMFCPCGWSAGIVFGKTEEEAIDNAFEKARKRYLED